MSLPWDEHYDSRGRRSCPPMRHIHTSPAGWHVPDEQSFTLGIVIKRNAVVDYKARCIYCGERSSTLPKKLAEKLLSAGHEVEWVRDHLNDSSSHIDRYIQYPRFKCCVRGCGEPGYEFHHFAPSNTFRDADLWPVLPLCRNHHTDWHRRMNGYQWNRKPENR